MNCLIDPTTKKAIINFGMIISTWLFYISVLSIIIPRSFMPVILDFILSQPTLMGI
jgi:hypothetical protein